MSYKVDVSTTGTSCAPAKVHLSLSGYDTLHKSCLLGFTFVMWREKYGTKRCQCQHLTAMSAMLQLKY